MFFKKKKFPFHQQPGIIDCGPTCLKMICDYHKKNFSLKFLTSISNMSKRGTSLYDLQEAAKKIGFNAYGTKLTVNELATQVALPCIIHMQKHYVVIPPQEFKDEITIVDPMQGEFKLEVNKFIEKWYNNEDDKGYALIIEQNNIQKEPAKTGTNLFRSFKYYIDYLIPLKTKIIFLLCLFLVNGLFVFLQPLITKNIVDVGIQNKNIKFVCMMLTAQLFLFLGSTLFDFIRAWLIQHINNNFSVSILRGFLVKLSRLPIKYFDNKKTGEIQQRFFDNYRIQSFLTSTSVSLVLAIVNFIAYFSSLIYFNWKILIVVLFFSACEIIWVISYLKKRKELDYAKFHTSSENQDNLLDLLSGMQEMKLNNYADVKINKWNKTQLEIFDLNVDSLKIDQQQSIGTSMLDQISNIIISFITAYSVIKGNMTFGIMMSVSFITGQLKGSISQFIFSFRSYQDAGISMDRLMEIHNEENEHNEKTSIKINDNQNIDQIIIDKVSYRYTGANEDALNNISFVIPKGKSIAIVGSSGSGKTTLSKILLKYYEPNSGGVYINNNVINLRDVVPEWWRNKCGVIMQEGYIFSATIKENIILANPYDEAKFQEALRIANINDYVESLTLKSDTTIGMRGIGLSGGQKQRILIARAVYKNPEILFLDEATSALDYQTEAIVINNILSAFPTKTKVIISHRLSTVKNADLIIVLDKGIIIEYGNHQELIASKSKYFELFSSQDTV
jgi:ATP-binding cassette, subfamily B, bacterial